MTFKQEYEIGDYVLIIGQQKQTSSIYFNPDMRKCIGKVAQITHKYGHLGATGGYSYAVDKNGWSWDASWLSPSIVNIDDIVLC